MAGAALCRFDQNRGEIVRMRDPYDALGVVRSASAAELKAVFQELVRKLHPDAIKHDPGTASRFAEINAAYEILGDKDKRTAFDSGEIDTEGNPRFESFESRGGAPAAEAPVAPGAGTGPLDADYSPYEEPGRTPPPSDDACEKEIVIQAPAEPGQRWIAILPDLAVHGFDTEQEARAFALTQETLVDRQGGQQVLGEVGKGQAPSSKANAGTNEAAADAEFIEVNFDEPVRTPRAWPVNPGPIPNKSSPWRRALLACGAAVFAYAIYVHRSQQVTPPTISGWNDLIFCSHAVSFDGSRELLLSEQHIATLYEKSVAKNEKSNEDTRVLGTWSFNDQSKKYILSLAGTTNAYTLLSPEQVSTCMLIKGNLDSADLRESWFSAEEDDPGDYDRDPGDRY